MGGEWFNKDGVIEGKEREADRMDECFDQSNKEGPLPVLFFFAPGFESRRVCVCISGRFYSNKALEREWRETAKGIV